ncbi:DUF6056 family protein, partial [Treponema endosymbiont of Eucomonympha sp.]|uniref:DUF6056 family protein n=1 Tax=Treponema endosymbiont of Eucomonympha sp. TaxID=1580831 RepID=UPI0027D33B55
SRKSKIVFPFRAIAGWGNENLCVAALFLLISYFVLKRHKKEPLALFEVFGAAVLLIGFALLLFSPGTHYRGTTVELKAQFSPLAWFFRQIALAAWRFLKAAIFRQGRRQPWALNCCPANGKLRRGRSAIRGGRVRGIYRNGGKPRISDARIVHRRGISVRRLAFFGAAAGSAGTD